MYFRFRASLYPCPETPQERKEMASGVNTRIDDLQMVKQNRVNAFLFVNWYLDYSVDPIKRGEMLALLGHHIFSGG